ncbi:MAG: hypothetical protein QW641_02015 [Candidatus Aenigmatarchaeota archaeon]
MKVDVKTLSALIIIIVMLASSFLGAINIVQQRIKTPPNIVEYEFDENIKKLLIQNYRTLITFKYNLDCEECLDTLYFLKDLVNRNTNQLFLQIISNERNYSIKIESMFGNKELNTPNTTEILKAICDLVYIELTDC